AAFRGDGGHMEQMSLVEPDHLASFRVSGNRLVNLASPQLIFPQPFGFGARLPTQHLDLLPIRSLEYLLPGDVQYRPVISHVHHPLLGEALPQIRFQTLVDLATVGNGSFSAFGSGLHTSKPDLEWPVMRVGHLVVQRYLLIGGILR